MSGGMFSDDLAVAEAVEIVGLRARNDAALLGAVYRLWCAELDRFGARDAQRSVVEEFRLALRVSRGECVALVGLALDLHRRFPLLLECMRDGLIDQYRAQQASEVFSTLDGENAAAADRRVSERIRTEGRPYDWRGYLRRVADAIDAQARAERTAQQRRDRYVSFLPEGDGVGTILGRLPIEDLAACATRVEGIARNLRAGGDERNLDQLRADVTVDLLLGRDRPQTGPVQTIVNVHIPVGTALEFTDDGCRLSGYGEIPAHVARALLTDPANALRKVLTDPDTGTVTGLGRTRYRPSRRQRDFVTARDQHCRAPGCHRPIAEIDHAKEWHRDDGHTDPANLQGLCVLDHKLKSLPGWEYHLDESTADVTLTTPTGRTYRSTPWNGGDDQPAATPAIPPSAPELR